MQCEHPDTHDSIKRRTASTSATGAKGYADAPVNNLEFKLIDPSGKNVWWVNHRDFTFPRDWKKITVRERDIEFAWGPAGGREPHHIGAIEIVVTAGTGGKGTVWIDDLALERLVKATPNGRASFAAAPRPY